MRDLSAGSVAEPRGGRASSIRTTALLPRPSGASQMPPTVPGTWDPRARTWGLGQVLGTGLDTLWGPSGLPAGVSACLVRL